MRPKWWLWGGAAIAALIVVAAGVGIVRLMGAEERGKGNGTPVRFEEPSPDELALRRIKIASADATLVEATLGEEGWTVRVEKAVSGLEPHVSLEEAKRFFGSLRRTEAEIGTASFVAKTDALKDVWGNSLKDVPLVRVGFDKATLARVSWDGVDPKNLLEIADDVWLHDLFEEALRQATSQSGGGSQGGAAGGQGGAAPSSSSQDQT